VRQLLASSLGVFMPSNPKEENLIYNEYGFVTAAVQKKSFLAVFIPWAICGIGALFYIYEYLLRVAPSVMTADLMLSFHIGAAALGNLAAFYYYIYTPMQLVVGLLMDRYGPRRLFTLAGLACGMGTYLFASTTNLAVAEMGRFLVGFGSAFGFVGVLKLATIWLPPERFAAAAGLTSALGTVGGILGNIALTSLVGHQGWRLTSYWAAVFGLGLTIVMFLFIRDSGKYQQQPASLDTASSRISFGVVLKGLANIIRNPQIWLVGVIGCLTYVTNSAFAELWGNPYLRQVYHYTPDQAAGAISASFLGWAIGGPIVGWFSDKIRQRRLPITIGAAAAAVAIAFVIYTPHIPLWAVYAALFLFGFFSCAHVVVFAVSREISPLRSAGTAVAVTNMFTMLGGVFAQPLIGKILDFHWSGQIVNGVRVYTAGDYQVALSILPLAMLFTVFLTFFLHETHGKPT
jgi:sugar phosphate permease